MKYCTNCGKQNDDHNKFCIACGKPFKTIVVSQQRAVKVDKEVNSLAQVSFLLGLISLLAFFMPAMMPFAIVLSIFAIVTGIIALIRKPKISRKKAIFGIVFATIALVLSIVLFVFIDVIIAYLKYFLQSYCNLNPESEECLMLEELLPNLFR